MSLYNMLNGVSSATFLVLPMLGKHPNEYPRFRDCFLRDNNHREYDDYIHIYTRTGGGNRNCYSSENDEMRAMPEYVTDWDDSNDNTYASWIFRIPEKWKADFDALKRGDIKAVSTEYREQMKTVFPNLTERFDEMLETPSK